MLMLMHSAALRGGVAGGAAAPGPRSFEGPQLVGVENLDALCKRHAFGTTPGPALALMRPVDAFKDF